MPTPTYDLIASNVLTSSASSVTFSSITSSYRDLVLIADWIGSTSISIARVRFNGDTGTNYNYVYMQGDGSAASSVAAANNDFFLGQTATQTVKAMKRFQIFDYSQTNKHKSILDLDSSPASGGIMGISGRWANTAAINSIEVYSVVSNFGIGSSFYLYGIVS